MKVRTPVTQSLMYAIRTRYIGPTDTMGSRIEAEIDNGGATALVRFRRRVPYDSALDSEANHAAAAVALVDARKSAGAWHESIRLTQASTGDGYVFIPQFDEERG